MLFWVGRIEDKLFTNLVLSTNMPWEQLFRTVYTDFCSGYPRLNT